MVIKITTLLTTDTSYTSHNHSVPFLGKHPAIPLNRQLINFLFTHNTNSHNIHSIPFSVS